MENHCDVVVAGSVRLTADQAGVLVVDDGEPRKAAAALDTGAVVQTRAVLVATGLTGELSEIAGVRGLWGSVVHHRPHCHDIDTAVEQAPARARGEGR